jgi:hypothetical protein
VEGFAGRAQVDEQFRHGVDRAANHTGDAPQAVALHKRLDDLDPLGRAQLVHKDIMRERSRTVKLNQHQEKSV